MGGYKMVQRGMFITFEGPEGGGKSTQVERFIKSLRELQYDVVQTREPGGTVISEKIRSILLDPNHHVMNHRTEMLLYAASRAQHVAEVIEPSLAQGKIVVCDRFIDASVAYQGYGLGLPVDEILHVNSLATNRTAPHRTYLLDLPVEVGMKRIAEKRGHNEDLQAVGLDRIESKELDYHRSVRQGFIEIAKKESERVKIIDATRDIEQIENEIREDFLRFVAR